MVFKKPYAFIIKHFRLLHLIMFIATLFLFNATNEIYRLFKSLLRSNTYTYAGASNYINNIIFFVIIAIIIISGIITWLLHTKKKPIILYFFTFIYSVMVLVLYLYLFSVLNTLQNDALTSDSILFLKDITFLFTVPEYVIMIFTFIRGIGFNIKQFNFSKDFEELDIVDKDSAEFEVLIGKNNYIYSRAIRKYLREIKYYIKENKFVLVCIGFAILVISAYLGINYYNNNVKKYKESDLINIDYISYVVNKSYITAYDYKGDKVKDGYKYVVINMNFYNSSTIEDKVLNLNLITLTDNDLVYYPIQTMNSKFYDLGMPYIDKQAIKPQELLNATLTYEIPESVKTNKFTLRVQYDIDTSLKEILVRYKNFNVNALNIDSRNIIQNVSLRETINTDVVNQNKFTINVNNYTIQDTYDNKYVVCTEVDKCELMSSIISSTAYGLKTMLILDYNATMYEDAIFTKYFNTFNKVFTGIGRIKYKVDNKEYISNIEVVENSDVENKLFAKVDRNIYRATSIYFELKFRDKTFTFPLKINATT